MPQTFSGRPTALYLLDEPYWDHVFGPDERAEVVELADVVAPMQTRKTILQNKGLLSGVEILLSAWWLPLLDEEFLDAAPNLKAIFYGSGSVKSFVTEAFWDRGIVLSSANSVFVIPVAEFTISQIVFCLKHGWQYAINTKRNRKYGPRIDPPGCYGSTVGLVSLGATGRLVAERLSDYDLNVIAYDPFASEVEAESLGVRLCSLEEVFSKSDIVSLHTPWLPETENMIRAEHFASMKKGASFLNTARGAVVDEVGFAKVFAERPDLFAVLDVVHPEPPAEDNPLFDLDNVVITPHIAGVMGKECRRGGRMAVEELRRYLEDKPLKGQITRQMISRIA
jgi:phosphoglycerate dehydrogenase-like enzyme